MLTHSSIVWQICLYFFPSIDVFILLMINLTNSSLIPVSTYAKDGFLQWLCSEQQEHARDDLLFGSPALCSLITIVRKATCQKMIEQQQAGIILLHDGYFTVTSPCWTPLWVRNKVLCCLRHREFVVLRGHSLAKDPPKRVTRLDICLNILSY